MATTEKVYLSAKELKGVIPKGVKVFRIEEIDKKYEFYYVGFEPPAKLSEDELKTLRPIYWYDLSLDTVKRYDQKTGVWVIAEAEAPKYAVSVETQELVGQVEEDEEKKKTVKVAKPIRALLDEDI